MYKHTRAYVYVYGCMNGGVSEASSKAEQIKLRECGKTDIRKGNSGHNKIKNYSPMKWEVADEQ